MTKSFSVRPLPLGLLLAATLLATNAQAILVSQDLTTAGDGLITLDTATGLQWLDLNLSQPWRINEPSLYLASGWSVASLGQVQTLIGNHFGSSISNGSRIPVVTADAQSFVGLFGPTFTSELSWGRFQSSVPGRAGQAIVRYDTGLVSYLISDDAFGEAEPHSFSGVFYVRNAPPPAPVILSGQGRPSDHAALSGGAVIDFETQVSGDSALSFDYAGVIMTGNNMLRITDVFDGSHNTTGNSLALTSIDRTQEIVFGFDTPVDAFGFNFGGTNETWHLVAYGAGDTVLEELDLPVIDPTNNGDWRGIAAEGIVSARLYNTGFDVDTHSGATDYIVLDNFTYFPAAVPEPESYALMLAGLCLVGWTVNRRRTGRVI